MEKLQYTPLANRFLEYSMKMDDTFNDSKHLAIKKNHGNVLEMTDSTSNGDLAA